MIVLYVNDININDIIILLYYYCGAIIYVFILCVWILQLSWCEAAAAPAAL
eukprot:COSAG06_NODE_39344_length_413_cov_3.509554_1_plen_50_part_01